MILDHEGLPPGTKTLISRKTVNGKERISLLREQKKDEDDNSRGEHENPREPDFPAPLRHVRYRFGIGCTKIESADEPKNRMDMAVVSELGIEIAESPADRQESAEKREDNQEENEGLASHAD